MVSFDEDVYSQGIYVVLEFCKNAGDQLPFCGSIGGVPPAICSAALERALSQLCVQEVKQVKYHSVQELAHIYTDA